MSVPFNSSRANTIGVEWEFALVDTHTRDLVNCADSLISRIHEQCPHLIPHVHKEFLLNTVELVTGVCANAPEATQELVSIVREVTPIVQQRGVELFGAGTHPFAPWSAAQLTQNPRYEEMINRTQWWGRQMLIWGVHVHVGITNADHVMSIITSFLKYYPHVLALAASSPMWESSATGYASNRSMLFQQLPTAGLPFHFNKWEEFEEFVHDQMTVGIIENINEIRWDIRPVPRFGTIEVRVSDSLSDFADLRAIIALTHCLIVWIDRAIGRNENLDQLKPWQVQENKWRASRYGLDAIIITHSDNTEEHIIDHLHSVLEELVPIAQELGCYEDLLDVLKIPHKGASYQRQERILAHNGGDPRSIVDAVIHELHHTAEHLQRTYQEDNNYTSQRV